MKDLTRNLTRFMPPAWLALALAAVVAAALLAAFVDTLQENVRQGEELRHWQRVGAVRHPIGADANTAPRSQTPEFLTVSSQSFQR
jgi:peptidoglycan/LPS O-acetylase OafA/YrhL